MSEVMSVEDEINWLLGYHEEDPITDKWDLPEGYEMVAEEEDTGGRWHVHTTIIFRNLENGRYFGLTNRIGATESQENEWADEILYLEVSEAPQIVQTFTSNGNFYLKALKA